MNGRSSDPEMPSGLAWIGLLVPNSVEPDITFPDGTIQTFARFSWINPPPAETPIHLALEAAWCSIRMSQREVGMTVTAAVNGTVMAESLLVIRTGAEGDETSWGERTVIRAPDTAGGGTIRATLRIERADVRRYARTTNTRLPIHDDLEHCAHLGFDDVVIQGVLVLAAIADCAELGSAGSIAGWFRAPMVAGARASVQRCDGNVWAVGGAEAAVLAVTRS